MKDLRNWRQLLVLGVAFALVIPATLLAQAPTGNVFGTVTDKDGAALPGVTVTLTGLGAPKTPDHRRTGAVPLPGSRSGLLRH